MDKASVSKFLRSCGSPPLGESSGGWIQAACVLAPWTHKSGRDSHPSFGIQVRPGAESLFKCFSCGQGGDLSYLLQLLTHYGAEAPRYDIPELVKLLQAEGNQDLCLDIADPGVKSKTEVVAWPENFLAAYEPAWYCTPSREYLIGRGLTETTCHLMDIRWDHHGQMVCFPIRNFDGELTGLRCRRLFPLDDQPKYHIQRWNGSANGAVWYGEHWIALELPVLMVESVFDVAAVLPIYPNVLSPMTAGMSMERVRRVMDSISECVTLFDNDDAGSEARKKIKKYSGTALVTHLTPPDPYKDPGEMPAEELRKILVDVLPLT